MGSSYNEFNDNSNLNFGDGDEAVDFNSDTRTLENANDNDSIKDVEHDDIDDSTHPGLYRLNKNSKRWRSMYALRDSLRSLTSCVSTKTSLANK